MKNFKYLLYAGIVFSISSFPLFAMDELNIPIESSDSRLKTSSVEAQDEFDFLVKHHPQLVTEAEKPFTKCYEEAKHYNNLTRLATKYSKSAEEVLMMGATEPLERRIFHWFGHEHEKYMYDQVAPRIDTLKVNHPMHGYFGTFFNRALENHTSLENIVLASEYIFQIVKDHGGGTVLFLGRTPCILQVAFEELLKIEKDAPQVPVHLNFSGHPDALTKRESTFFKSSINIARDMVTPNKLSHYFSYLDTKNILQTKKLFIVDIIGSGSSLNSFLRIIGAYYQKRAMELPAISFLNLTTDINWSTDRSEYYTFKQIGDISSQGTLYLPEDKKRNFKHFQVPSYAIPIYEKILTEILDQDMFQEFLVHGIQYPAQKWTPEFDAQRSQGGQYHSNFYTYLRENFSRLILSHQK
jgi:hypothetical protein